MEKQPNLNIGDQEFQKVGKMKSEPTGLKSSPESFDLYQDTENGALMGKLPEYHLEAEGFDLTRLTPSEAGRLLMTEVPINEMELVNIDKKLEIYGKINNGSEGELSVFMVNNMGRVSYYVFYKDSAPDIVKSVRDAVFTWLQNAHPLVEIKSVLEKYKIVEIEPEHITVAGKNSLLVKDKDGKDSAEISFLEIPKAYTELMEEKTGKAE